MTGVVISGALTDLASWRWILYINVPIALLGLLLVPGLVSESRMEQGDRRLDLPGALVATGGLVAIVYGTLLATSSPWASWPVLLPLVGGVGLLIAMILIELNTKNPVIPLRFFRDRTRVAANLSGLLFASGFFSYIFLMTLFLQQVLGYTALRGGLAYLRSGSHWVLGCGWHLGCSHGLVSNCCSRWASSELQPACSLLATSAPTPLTSPGYYRAWSSSDCSQGWLAWPG